MGETTATALSYLMPLAMLVQSGGTPDGTVLVTLAGMARNLAVVTAGNLVGGSVLVALAYHVIYRQRPVDGIAGAHDAAIERPGALTPALEVDQAVDAHSDQDGAYILCSLEQIMAKSFMQSFLGGPWGLFAALALPLLLLHDHASSLPQGSVTAELTVNAAPQLRDR